MSLYADILKITQLPQTDENPVFVRRKEANVFKRNQKLKKLKPPRNANLFADDNDNDNQQYIIPKERFVHEIEIASSINEANCGINYSNDNLEKHWKSKQIEASSNCEDYTSKKLPSDNNNYENSTTQIHSEISTLEEDSVEDEEHILKKCRLHKNAVIRGLLRNHTISLKDLYMPNDCTNIKNKTDSSIQNQNSSSSSSLNEENFVKLVQCPEDPEVFVQPLQAYGSIDENKYKDIDFTVPHIGKKITVTPRQFYVNTDDSDFDFIKKDTKYKTA